MKKNKGIVDARGNPVGKTEDSVEDLNLPPGVQALVEGRINDAVDRLRHAQTNAARGTATRLHSL